MTKKREPTGTKIADGYVMVACGVEDGLDCPKGKG